MAKKHIRLLNATFATQSSTPKDETVLHKFRISAAFDQVAANTMGIKESWYDENGHLREQMREGKPGLELFGATIALRIKQGNLFDAGKELLQTPALQISDFAIRRHKDNDALVVRFSATLADGDDAVTLWNFYRGVRTGQFDVTIEQPSKEKEFAAMTQAKSLGLFRVPGESAEEDEAEEATEEGEEDAPAAFVCKHCDKDIPLEDGGTHHMVNGRRVKCEHASAGAVASKQQMDRLTGKAN